MTLLQAIVLGAVEGLTEFLPVSSTGHVVLTSALFGINEDHFVKQFTIIIQFGAILSVLVAYWPRLMKSFDLYKKVLVAFLPAAVLGLLVKNKIDALLGDVEVVAWSLVIGGIVLILVDRLFDYRQCRYDIEDISPKQATLIGFTQCIAFIPGVSRSGATLVGGLWQRLSREHAAEFSFFLAVPTLTAAAALKTFKAAGDLNSDHLLLILIGNVVSFLIGLVTIRAFVRYLVDHGLLLFGIYRIVVGIFILMLP